MLLFSIGLITTTADPWCNTHIRIIQDNLRQFLASSVYWNLTIFSISWVKNATKPSTVRVNNKHTSLQSLKYLKRLKIPHSCTQMYCNIHKGNHKSKVWSHCTCRHLQSCIPSQNWTAFIQIERVLRWISLPFLIMLYVETYVVTPRKWRFAFFYFPCCNFHMMWSDWSLWSAKFLPNFTEPPAKRHVTKNPYEKPSYLLYIKVVPIFILASAISALFFNIGISAIGKHF